MPTRRHFLQSTLAALAAPTILRAAEPASKPNIVCILCDDLGYGDLRCMTPASKIATPNIDRFASQGMRFTDAHSGSGVCTPTRYGVLTGRYCWRSRLTRGVLGGYSPALIEPGRLTVPAMLRQQGYATGCVGKWHLGMDWPLKNPEKPANENNLDFARPVANGPTTRGFDYYFGIAASLDMPPYCFIENDRVTAAPTDRQEAGGYVRRGPKAPGFQFDQVLPTLAKKAGEFIAKQAAAGKPFFLYMPLNAPHTPVVPSKAFKGKSQVGDYGDFVMEVDWAVGQVLQALDDATVAGNTLVILTSDNGPERIAYPRIEEFGHRSMGDLRGLKRDTWEGGHRVPFIARWPGRIAPGATSAQTSCLTDLMATAAAIVGAALPADAGEDSFSLLPALLGQDGGKPIRPYTIHHSGSGKFAIRQGTWVLIDAPSGDDNKEPPSEKQSRGYQPHNQPAELYDLSADLSERRNAYAENRAKANELKALLESCKSAGRSR